MNKTDNFPPVIPEIAGSRIHGGAYGGGSQTIRLYFNKDAVRKAYTPEEIFDEDKYIYIIYHETLHWILQLFLDFAVCVDLDNIAEADGDF